MKQLSRNSGGRKLPQIKPNWWKVWKVKKQRETEMLKILDHEWKKQIITKMQQDNKEGISK